MEEDVERVVVLVSTVDLADEKARTKASLTICFRAFSFVFTASNKLKTFLGSASWDSMIITGLPSFTFTHTKSLLGDLLRSSAIELVSTARRHQVKHQSRKSEDTLSDIHCFACDAVFGVSVRVQCRFTSLKWCISMSQNICWL